MITDVMKAIAAADPEVGAGILKEYERQRGNIELIASENIVSEPVILTMGTVLTNKRRRARDPRHRESQEAFRLRLCQRPAPFRRTGQYGGHHGHL